MKILRDDEVSRTIHQIWLGSEVPTRFLESMADWQILNPDWTYRLWTRELPDLYNANLYDSAHAYVKPDAVWQFRADLLRYEILYRYGGFYCDVDTKPLRPLEGLFDFRSEWAVAENDVYVGNTYLYSEPDNPIFRDLVVNLSEHLCGAKDLAATVASGPQYLTDIWNDHDGWVDEETKLWFPYDWYAVKRGTMNSVPIPENAYAIHEWNHQREKKKQHQATYRRNFKQENGGAST